MQERNILVRFLAVPRRQKFVAAVIAIAIGGRIFLSGRAAPQCLKLRLCCPSTRARQGRPIPVSCMQKSRR